MTWPGGERCCDLAGGGGGVVTWLGGGGVVTWPGGEGVMTWPEGGGKKCCDLYVGHLPPL